MGLAADWKGCAESGMTCAEAAEYLGLTARAGRRYALRHGFRFRDPRVPDWKGCAERGMTCPEAAAHLGRSAEAGWRYASRHGFSFRSSRQDAGRALMLQRWQDPAYRAVHLERILSPEFKAAATEGRRNSGGRRKSALLAQLTETERRDYDTLRRHEYRRAEALEAIGRADLVPA